MTPEQFKRATEINRLLEILNGHIGVLEQESYSNGTEIVFRSINSNNHHILTGRFPSLETILKTYLLVVISQLKDEVKSLEAEMEAL